MIVINFHYNEIVIYTIVLKLSNVQTSLTRLHPTFSIARIMIVINFHYNEIVIYSHCPQIVKCPNKPHLAPSYVFPSL